VAVAVEIMPPRHLRVVLVVLAAEETVEQVEPTMVLLGLAILVAAVALEVVKHQQVLTARERLAVPGWLSSGILRRMLLA